LRARAMGNSFRVTTSSLMPPKSMSAMIAFLSFIVSRRVMALDLIHWNDFYKSFAALVQGLNFGDSHHNLEISA
jgi:ABC-type microcin C transport system permease subunit YejE